MTGGVLTEVSIAVLLLYGGVRHLQTRFLLSAPCAWCVILLLLLRLLSPFDAAVQVVAVALARSRVD